MAGDNFGKVELDQFTRDSNLTGGTTWKWLETQK